MSSILSIRPGGASTTPLNRHRSGDARTSAPTGQDDGALLLPRLLLVELAGVAADVTSLRERLDDDSQLHGPLDRIRGRLDDLVDSIYERAVDPAPRPVDASSGHGSAITADRPGTAEAVRSGTASTAS